MAYVQSSSVPMAQHNGNSKTRHVPTCSAISSSIPQSISVSLSKWHWSLSPGALNDMSCHPTFSETYGAAEKALVCLAKQVGPLNAPYPFWSDGQSLANPHAGSHHCPEVSSIAEPGTQ